MRLAVAKQQGVDETMVSHIFDRNADGLSERHRLALRLADALMTQPGAIDPSLVAELQRHFTREELLELTLDVMKWNYQKVPVALGTDQPVDPDQLTDLVFDADGHWVRPD